MPDENCLVAENREQKENLLLESIIDAFCLCNIGVCDGVIDLRCRWVSPAGDVLFQEGKVWRDDEEGPLTLVHLHSYRITCVGTISLASETNGTECPGPNWYNS